MFYLLITLAMGLLMPFQTAANSRLRGVVGPAYVSTLVSFSVSTLALLLVSLLAGIPILPTHEMLAEAPCWSWFVGIIAVVTITIAIHLFKEIGQLQALIIPMFSQLIFSLLIDHFGWFGAKVIPFGTNRIIGALLLIIGVTLVVVLPKLKTQKTGNTSTGSRQAFWQLMAIISGCLSASITGAYAQLSNIVGNPVQATTVAFFVATMILLLFCTCLGKTQLIGKAFSRSYPWWMWTGGLCGAVIVFGNAWLVPKVGVGVFVMALLVGQLALSMLMEHYGWLGAPRKSITWVKIIGILLMLAGVALIRL
ncbi:MAG: DMT family transporter [Muribaculaceae bacterium]|nr:DMT family transporter [Muribaculaceae bacterium]